MDGREKRPPLSQHSTLLRCMRYAMEVGRISQTMHKFYGMCACVYVYICSSDLSVWNVWLATLAYLVVNKMINSEWGHKESALTCLDSWSCIWCFLILSLCLLFRCKYRLDIIKRDMYKVTVRASTRSRAHNREHTA